MAMFLIANLPVAGHVNPCIPIARELIARGHDVRWYSGSRFKETIEATGATFIPAIHAPDIDELHPNEMFPGRVGLKGLAGLKYDFKHIFLAPPLISEKILSIF